MGRSRGGLTSKVHAVMDTNGLPVRLDLTPGESRDNRLCAILLAGLRPKTILLPDRGHATARLAPAARLPRIRRAAVVRMARAVARYPREWWQNSLPNSRPTPAAIPMLRKGFALIVFPAVFIARRPLASAAS